MSNILLGLVSLFALFASCSNALGQWTSPVTNVVNAYNCVGDGVYNAQNHTWSGTPNDNCFASALQGVSARHETLYFPAGVYLFSSQPLLITNAAGSTAFNNTFSSASIVGEGENSTYIVHNSSNQIEASIDFEPQSADQAFFNPSVENITVIGGPMDKYVVKNQSGAHLVIRNTRAAGATKACFYMYEAVDGLMENAACDEFTSAQFPGVGLPSDGIVLDGNPNVGGGYFSAPFQVISPKIEGLSGTALDIELGGGVSVSSCQISGNKQSLYISDSSSANVISSCLFENESQASYIGGFNSEIVSSTFSNIANPATGIIVSGRGNTLRGVVVGAGPIQVLPTAQNTSIISPLLNSIPLSSAGSDQGLGIIDLGLGTKITDVHLSIGVSGGNYTQNESSVASGPNQPSLGANTSHVMSSVWAAGTSSAPTPLSYARFTPGKSWRMFIIGAHFGSLFGAGDVAFPPFYELTETNNTIVNPDGTVQTFSISPTGVLGYSVPSSTGGSEFLEGQIIFSPDITSTVSGTLSMHLSGGIEMTGSQEQAPTGVCTQNGQWIHSNDGHISFCNGSTWVLKI